MEDKFKNKCVKKCCKAKELQYYKTHQTYLAIVFNDEL